MKLCVTTYNTAYIDYLQYVRYFVHVLNLIGQKSLKIEAISNLRKHGEDIVETFY